MLHATTSLTGVANGYWLSMICYILSIRFACNEDPHECLLLFGHVVYLKMLFMLFSLNLLPHFCTQFYGYFYFNVNIRYYFHCYNAHYFVLHIMFSIVFDFVFSILGKFWKIVKTEIWNQIRIRVLKLNR